MKTSPAQTAASSHKSSLSLQGPVGRLLPRDLVLSLCPPVPEAAHREQPCSLLSHVMGVTKPKHNEAFYILPSGQQSQALWNMKMEGEDHVTLLWRSLLPALCKCD